MTNIELGFLFIIISSSLMVLTVMLCVLICVANDLDTIKKIMKKEITNESNNDEH